MFFHRFEMHKERIPVDGGGGFSVFEIFEAFVPDEYEAWVAEVDDSRISDGDDRALHHIEHGGAFGRREVNARMPRLIGADGVPAAGGDFCVGIIPIEQVLEHSAARFGQVPAFIGFADEHGQAVSFAFDPR